MSSTTIKVSGKEQIFTIGFLVADDQDVEINFSAAAAAFRMTVRFSMAPPPQGIETPSGRWELVDGVTRFTFFGWTNVLTSALPMQRFGDVNGRGLFFQLIHRKIGTSLNEVTWWVLLEAAP